MRKNVTTSVEPRKDPVSMSSADLDLTMCDREAIHIPGFIQPHGVLIAADSTSFVVSHVSANFARSTGIPSRSALGSHLAQVVGSKILDELASASAQALSPTSHVLTLKFPFDRDPIRTVVHHVYGSRLILELELAQKTGDQARAISHFQAIVGALRQASSVDELCDVAASSMQSLTGYDRVLVYRFGGEGHGEVIAESKRPDLESYLRLHYPASDIPAQARRLYLKHRVRQIADVNYRPVAMLADPNQSEPETLDMSHCGLRGVSPFHIEYLQNMGVGATLAISLIQDERLWGMIVCHHLAPHAVPADRRAICDLLGQMLSLLIVKAEEREDMTRLLERREMLQKISQSMEAAISVPAGLAAESQTLMDMADAHGLALRFNGHLHLFGITPPIQAAEALVVDLLESARDGVFASDDLGTLFPKYQPLAQTVSGALLLPVLNNPGDAIAWFRPEVGRTVVWGGDPAKPVAAGPGPQRISPRQSFAAWRELVRGKSAPWASAEIRIVQDLRRRVADSLLHHAEAQLIRLSTVDPLTGLPNRRQLEQALTTWDLAGRQDPAAVLFFDLDRFKSVNDTLGHAAGDELLLEIARRLTTIAPSGGIIARLGGDEFVVFIKGDLAPRATDIADELLKSFQVPLQVFGRTHHASASIGVAFATPGCGDLLQEADVAMYSAKRQGGGRVVVFQAALQEQAVRTLQLEQDLFIGLNNNEFTLVYQPVILTADGSPYGFEALARWSHPKIGQVPPARFIPLAEETGIIEPLGRWIMETGLKQLAVWHAQNVRVSINISPRQLKNGQFKDWLEVALRQHNLNPGQIVIEVTEGTLMDANAVDRLVGLHETGVKIALDDFGTGYSSLAYLRHLPIDIVKIDRSFVMPLGQDAKAERFFKTLVALAHGLDMFVIAEGVETLEQFAFVKNAKCDAYQGFLASKPVRPEEAMEVVLAPIHAFRSQTVLAMPSTKRKRPT